jgi:hypothetical protein
VEKHHVRLLTYFVLIDLFLCFSVTRLAAFAAGCEIFEIKLSRGYSESHFREDLKILYNKLGMENKKIVFMFGDQHVAEDGKLSLNHILINFFIRIFGID